MKQAIVLGCGMIGATIARDLAADPELATTVADVDPKNFARLDGVARVETRQADLSEPGGVAAAVADFDLVVGALPSVFGFQTLKTVIEAGKPYCDISFMPEDALELDGLARQRGVAVVVDCGVAPGLASMLIGHCHARLDRTDDVVFYVGGLPKSRPWPYQYKAPFAPSDVVEEYTRPARLIEDGQIVVRPALSDAELLDFPRVGTLEAFHTDGLRSLLKTIPARNMREKTLRYPGHVELMRVLRETGFFSKEAIELRGTRVRPIDVTARLLFPMWQLERGEPEFTVLRVRVSGEKGGRPASFEFNLYDETDATTGQSSMARTTGFPAAIVARWLARGEFADPGVHPPERLGMRAGLMERMINELAGRGVMVEETLPLAR